MSDRLIVQSHKGPYAVDFSDGAFAEVGEETRPLHYVIDSRVAELYGQQLGAILASGSVLLVDAKESNKSLERSPEYVTHLLSRGIKRGHVLVAIGGGIVQDITCFIAAVLLRGIEWHFYPTTLLAQADSCIGSKSSINVGAFKNVIGTYTPPSRIFLGTAVLATLPEVEIRSGLGEMLKVHMISGPEAFNRITADYGRIITDRSMMRSYILRSLEIKKAIIEQDEFDRGIRTILNLGHSFGHAIESATNFNVPHGIAVSIGIDMANFTSVRLGRMGQGHFDRMHPTLRLNYRGFERTEIPTGKFFAALAKDKKNTDSNLVLILPDGNAVPRRVECPNDESFRAGCREYFSRARLA